MTIPADTDPNFERRYHVDGVKLREAGSKQSITGYAAMFNKRSDNLGGFVEVIKPGAFDGVLDNDVVALFNHDKNLVLGRSGRGVSTLKLKSDKTGLKYQISLPDTQAARDLMVNIQRGEVSQSSFAFSVQRDGVEWIDDEDDGVIVRVIHKMRRLFDVSPVTFAAYPDTTVAARGVELARKQFDEIRKEAEHHGVPEKVAVEIDRRRRRLALINLGG